MLVMAVLGLWVLSYPYWGLYTRRCFRAQGSRVALVKQSISLKRELLETACALLHCIV